MSMAAIITCCKDCQERHPGCHATCEKYIKQKAEHDERTAEYRKEHSVNSVDYQKFDGIYKAMNRYRVRSRHKRRY